MQLSNVEPANIFAPKLAARKLQLLKLLSAIQAATIFAPKKFAPVKSPSDKLA